jgi:hypothetical protein
MFLSQWGTHRPKKNREHFYVNEEHIGEKRRGNKMGKSRSFWAKRKN